MDRFCSGLLGEGGDTLQRTPLGTAGHTWVWSLRQGGCSEGYLLPPPFTCSLAPRPPGLPESIPQFWGRKEPDPRVKFPLETDIFSDLGNWGKVSLLRGKEQGPTRGWGGEEGREREAGGLGNLTTLTSALRVVDTELPTALSSHNFLPRAPGPFACVSLKFRTRASPSLPCGPQRVAGASLGNQTWGHVLRGPKPPPG